MLRLKSFACQLAEREAGFSVSVGGRGFCLLWRLRHRGCPNDRLVAVININHSVNLLFNINICFLYFKTLVLPILKQLPCIASKTSHLVTKRRYSKSCFVLCHHNLWVSVFPYHLYIGEVLSHKGSQTPYSQQWVKWEKIKDIFCFPTHTHEHAYMYTHTHMHGKEKNTCIAH